MRKRSGVKFAAAGAPRREVAVHDCDKTHFIDADKVENKLSRVRSWLYKHRGHENIALWDIAVRPEKKTAHQNSVRLICGTRGRCRATFPNEQSVV